MSGLMPQIWNMVQEPSLQLLQWRYHSSTEKSSKERLYEFLCCYPSNTTPSCYRNNATNEGVSLEKCWNEEMQLKSSPPMRNMWGIPTGNTPSAQEHCNPAKQHRCASPWPHYKIYKSKHEPMSCYLLSYKPNELYLTIGPTIMVSIHFWILSLQYLCYLLKQANPLRQRCWLGQSGQLKVILIMFTPLGVYFSY